MKAKPTAVKNTLLLSSSPSPRRVRLNPCPTTSSDSLQLIVRLSPRSLGDCKTQEFFRGSLSKNPLYSTDIIPSAAGGGSGSTGGGGAAAAAGAAGGASSAGISGVAEATMRNLRDKIATDLDMADAVRLFLLLSFSVVFCLFLFRLWFVLPYSTPPFFVRCGTGCGHGKGHLNTCHVCFPFPALYISKLLIQPAR